MWTQTSFYQRDVGRCLETLGIAHVSEDTRTGLAVDIFVPEYSLAVELDGPTHFFRNRHQPLGPTAFKHRLLRAAGLAVASISIEEWDELRGRTEQRTFLERVLARHARR